MSILINDTTWIPICFNTIWNIFYDYTTRTNHAVFTYVQILNDTGSYSNPGSLTNMCST